MKKNKEKQTFHQYEQCLQMMDVVVDPMYCILLNNQNHNLVPVQINIRLFCMDIDLEILKRFCFYLLFKRRNVTE